MLGNSNQKELHDAGGKCVLNSVDKRKVTGNNNWKNYINSVNDKDSSHQGQTNSIANKDKQTQMNKSTSQKGVKSLATEKNNNKPRQNGDNIGKNGDNIEKKGDNIGKKGDNIGKNGDNIEKNGDKIRPNGDNTSSAVLDHPLAPYKPIKAIKVKSRCVAIDCEMVGGDPDGQTDILARVSLVNSSGTCIYDTFVKSSKPVVDYRTFVSGVREEDMLKGKLYKTVQADVLNLIKGKILVGHSLHSDLKVLKIWHPSHLTRDTSRFKKFREITTRTPGLKLLTSHFLNVNIQDGEHSSIVDAQAAMQLYMMFREEWEAEVRSRRPAHIHVRKESTKAKPSHRPKRMHKNYRK